MKKTARLKNLLKSDCGQCSSCCRNIMVEVTGSDIERLIKHTGYLADKLVKLYSNSEIESEEESDWIKLSYGKQALGLNKTIEPNNREYSMEVWKLLPVFGTIIKR